MQLHACLLLFIITTDKTLALLHHQCGGNISLDQEPAGHISLAPPGLFHDTNSSMKLQTEETLGANCTWRIDLPLGQTVLLKAARLGGNGSISVSCVRDEADQVLGSGGTARLSGCDGGQANLLWTGTANNSKAIQLSYFVQEDVRNSSEDRTSSHSDQDPVRPSQTGTSVTSPASVGREVAGGTDGSRGNPDEGLGVQSVSGPSSQDQGRLHPTSPLPGLTLAGRTDRETLPLPEEEANNVADTSGAAHLADSPTSASRRTHPYFHTQHTPRTDTLSHKEITEISSSDELLKTPMVNTPTDGTVRSSDALLGTDTYTIHGTSDHADRHTSTQAHPNVSGSSAPPRTSSLITGENVIIPGEAVSRAPVEKQPDPWRSQRSTDRLISNGTFAITHDPLKSLSESQRDDSGGAHTDAEPTSSSSSQSTGRTYSTATLITELDTAAGTVSAFHTTSQTDSLASTDVTGQTTALGITKTQTDSPQSTESLRSSPPADTSTPFTRTSNGQTQTATQGTQRNVGNAHVTATPTQLDNSEGNDWTLSFTGSSSTQRARTTSGDVVQNSAEEETETLGPTHTLIHDTSTHTSFRASSLSQQSEYTLRTTSPGTPVPPTSATTVSAFVNRQTPPAETPTTHDNLPLTSSTVPAIHKPSHDHVTTTQADLPSFTTANTEYVHVVEEVEEEKEDESLQWPRSYTTTHPTAAAPSSWTTPHPSQESHSAHKPSGSAPTWKTTATQPPKYYVVPDQPATIRVESIELLLQIIVEEYRASSPAGLEEETAAWVEPYLHRASGFSRLLGVWSSGRTVQSLVEFKTRGALRWLRSEEPTSLLEQTGLAQAVREGRSFRSSKITNITLGGLQGDVCDWLLQCPAGYECLSQPGTANYSCPSVCHSDYCHHHGICTHHPGQLPVCHCLVGEDFWFMGQRCDVRMTRARLVGACFAVLLIVVTVIAVLALVAVRRYRTILIQAKVDQTRSSYRRFNHFDELSGRFWLRSLAGSADSLDNPAFTRSDELLHLRALDRPCCYHDDTLSLASTCPSHGTHINTIYPHSSQYGWRGSEMSMGDGVLDSGKASDLSVCSWPVEPIHWTPFPLLQQLASHRTPTVRVSRPRSYCEGMELVDLGKSWTA